MKNTASRKTDSMIRDAVPSDESIRRAELLKIVDGDTLRLQIDLGFTVKVVKDVRLLGCDTPEVRGAERLAGKYVAGKVHNFFDIDDEIVIESADFSVGKYGRSLCNVWCGDKCLNQWLLLNRLAWPVDASGSLVVKRSLDYLDLPEAIVNQIKSEVAGD